MRITKPNWVEHTDEKGKKLPIYTLSVHPEGVRLATGSIDKKVKIWSTPPILDALSDENLEYNRLLCTMSAHNGSVLTVRWNHYGNILASGSDDMIIMIYAIDQNGGGRVFGSEDVNVENWKPLMRLVGHTADVVDIAFSRDDSMMASVGLDNTVIIWNGGTFAQIRKITQHSDFVKGVTWDPVGNYLATQSDDKTVKIWNTKDWTLQKTINEPFENSPKSTFFRRLSWSPDGAFICASNAKNNTVFVACIIERGHWKSDVSFVGHENTIQVAAFNPLLFFRKGEERTANLASTMVALGADDFSISIWRNSAHKALIVLHDIFALALHDLGWSNDGLNLYGCSADGTICAVSFDKEEFPDLVDEVTTLNVLKEQGYVDNSPWTKRGTRPVIPKSPLKTNGNGVNHAPAARTEGGVNMPMVKKSHPNAPRRRLSIERDKARQQALLIPAAGVFGGGGGFGFDAPIQPLGANGSTRGTAAQMFEDAGAAFGGGIGGGEGSRGLKRRISFGAEDGPRGGKGKTLGSRVRGIDEIREIRAPRAIGSGSGRSTGRGTELPIPGLQNVLRTKIDEEVYFEAENAEDGQGKNKVTFVNGDEEMWIDYQPSRILVLGGSERFVVVGREDGGVVAYGHAGKRLLDVRLDSIPTEVAAAGNMLVVINSDCMCRVYNTRTAKIHGTATSLAHLLDTSLNDARARSYDISRLGIQPNGTPYIITTEPAAYALSFSIQAWIPLVTPFQLSATPVPRNGLEGVLARIEAEVKSLWDGKVEEDKPAHWDESMEMQQIEMRVRGAEVLGSGEEWRSWVIRLGEMLGRQGYVERGRQVVEGLMGPIYHQHGKLVDWDPAVGGLSKRSVAKEVLGGFSQYPLFREMIGEYGKLFTDIEGESM